MSGLFSSLANGVMALTAQSRGIETAGRNLANVSNPNYARQRIVLGDNGDVQTAQGVESMGVEAKSVQQLRDPLIDRQLVRESSITASYTAEQNAYQQAQTNLGESIDLASGATGSGSSGVNAGIAQPISDLFTAFQSLAANTTDPGARQTLIQKAGILTDSLQGADRRLSQLQSDLTTQVNGDVSNANQALDRIAQLNSEIGRFEINNPGSAVNLRDQRQAALESLAKTISIDTLPDPAHTGEIVVFSKDASGTQVNLVTGPNVNGPITVSGGTVSGGSPSTALALNGGSINGELKARDGVVQTLRDSLNGISKQLVVSVNAAYNPTGTTGDFFSAGNRTAATISVDPSVTATTLKASDGGPAGDSTIASSVYGLVNQSFSIAAGDTINGTFNQVYSNAVTNLGQKLTTTNQNVTEQGNVETLVRNQRDSVSGVSMDEEMADLMKYQRAFQASARVITVIDDLLDTVVNKMGL